MNWNIVLMVVGFALMLLGALRAFPPKQNWQMTIAPNNSVEMRDDTGVWRRFTVKDGAQFKMDRLDGPGGREVDAVTGKPL